MCEKSLSESQKEDPMMGYSLPRISSPSFPFLTASKTDLCKSDYTNILNLHELDRLKSSAFCWCRI